MAVSMKCRVAFVVAYFGGYHYIPFAKESGKATA
jgi:hypothetical protein